MRKVLAAQELCGEELVSYYLLVGDEAEFAENYGVEVVGCGERVSIPGITCSQMQVHTLLSAMVRCGVTPVAARDVVEDWLLA